MAAEFYHKTAALFEEFKKRELHYLNMELKVNSNLGWMNESGIPAQDSLQKINKMERETEKTYRDLMKHMEELDMRTEQMSLKIHKLNALRNVAVNSSFTSRPSFEDTSSRPLQPYYSSAFHYSASTDVLPASTHSSTFYPGTRAGALYPIPTSNYSPLQALSRDISIQTDHIFCEQCHYPFHLNSMGNLSNANGQSSGLKEVSVSEKMPTKDLQPSLKVGMSFPDEPPPHDDCVSVNKNPDLIHYNTALDNDSYVTPVKNELPTRNIVSDNNGIKPGVNEISKIAYPKTLDNNSYAVSAESNMAPEQSRGGKEIFVDDSNSKIHMKEISEKVSDLKEVRNDIESEPYVEVEMDEDNTMSSSENLDKVISKSDNESVNNEFDFLESDRKSIIKGTKLNQTPNNHLEMTTNLKEHESVFFQGNSSAISEKTSASDMITGCPNTKLSDNRHNLEVKSKDTLEVIYDAQSDSSVSRGHSPSLHSENASMASESDSLSEKDIPLTATAAYQALLGNVVAEKTVQKSNHYSDSDSEDEIENALATAVRKSSHIPVDAPLPAKKAERKESVADVKSKNETRTANPISVSKPQNKLSKSTRKVLGLETSSGSELELAVKGSTNNKAEDSDEFDFYD